MRNPGEKYPLRLRLHNGYHALCCMESTKHTHITNGVVRQITTLIEGNHARGSDMRRISANSTDALFQATLKWRFTHEMTTKTVQGNGAVQGGHHGYDKALFDQGLHDLCDRAASDREARVPFMTGSVNAEETTPGSRLEHSGNRQRVHDFASLSMHRKCGRCGGNGFFTDIVTVYSVADPDGMPGRPPLLRQAVAWFA